MSALASGRNVKSTSGRWNPVDHPFRLHALHWFHLAVCEIISLSILIQNALLQTIVCLIHIALVFFKKLSVPPEDKTCLLLTTGIFFVFYFFTQTMSLTTPKEFLKFWLVHRANMLQKWNWHIRKCIYLLSFEGNSIRLGGPANGIVTKAVHKTLPGVVGVTEVGVWVGWGLVDGGGLGWWGSGSSGSPGVMGVYKVV